MKQIDEWNSVYKETYPNVDVPSFELIICDTQEELFDQWVALIGSSVARDKLKATSSKKSEGTFLVSESGAYYILLLNTSAEGLAYEYWHELTHMITYDKFQINSSLSYDQIYCCDQFTSKDELIAYLASDLIAFKHFCGNVDKTMAIEFAKGQLKDIINKYPTNICDGSLYNIQRISGYILAVQQMWGELLIDYIPTEVQEYLYKLNSEIT